MDPKKLMLGLAFYGQSFRLAEAEGARNTGATAAGPGEPGEFTKQPGMLAYYEICYRGCYCIIYNYYRVLNYFYWLKIFNFI